MLENLKVNVVRTVQYIQLKKCLQVSAAGTAELISFHTGYLKMQ